MHAIFNRLKLLRRSVPFSLALLLFPFVQSIQKSYSKNFQFPHLGKHSINLIKKNDYINRLASNSKEFYFLIIYAPDTQNEAFMLAAKLSSLFPDLPSFLIPFSDYQDALKTINRIKNDQIYSIPNSVKDLTLYFFTPYSQNPVQVKYKSLLEHQLRGRREEGQVGEGKGGRGRQGGGVRGIGGEGEGRIEEESGRGRGRGEEGRGVEGKEGSVGGAEGERKEGGGEEGQVEGIDKVKRILPKKVRRVVKKVRRMENLIEVIDEKGLKKVLKEAWRKRVGEGVIVRVGEGVGRKEEEVGGKKEDGGGDEFRKVVFNALNLKLLPMGAKVLILNDDEAKKKYKLSEGEIYFFRNDILQRFKEENNTTMILPSSSPGIEIEGVRLERYEGKNLSGFMEFILPRVFILNDVKPKSVSTFFKKVTYNRDRLIFSYVQAEPEITLNRKKKKPNKLNKEETVQLSHDANEESEEGIVRAESKLFSWRRIFFNLYDKYGDQMLFVILNNEKLEELFPHGNPLLPKFCIFNFFNQERPGERKEGDGGREGLIDWYGKLLYPYEKYFLEGKKEEEIERKVEAVLRREAKKDYLSTSYDLVQEINGEFLNDNNLWNGKEEEKAVGKRFIQIYGENKGELVQRKAFNELAEQRNDVKFYRMNYLNGCKWIPHVGGEDKTGYIVIDLEKKEVKVMEIGRNEEVREKLRKFLE